MKQLLFLLLFPCLALAQYQGNANQKITLGEQTSADGLVYRGLAADTTRKPSVDTMAYILLDTNTNIIWQYKKAVNNAWTRVGGSISSGVTGVLPVANGGTNVSSLTSSGVLYASSSSQVATSSNLTYNGSTALSIQNIRIWKGRSNQDASMAIGFQALDSMISPGEQNMAIGYQSQFLNTTGSYNNSYGFQTLYSNKTSNFNNAFGYRSLYETTGERNSGLGAQSLYSNTSGGYNVGIGFEAGYSNTTGDQNTFIGYRAGQPTNGNTTGNNNTIIGSQAVGASATASNVITLGNSSIATIRAQVTTITSLSDIRDKTEILPLNYGMNFIDKLKPVSFVWDMRDGGKIGIPEIGFIAQDLQQAQIDSGINIPNLISGVDEKLEASYGVLLPIIVKAMQEANEKIKSLEKRILNLENK